MSNLLFRRYLKTGLYFVMVEAEGWKRKVVRAVVAR